MKSNLQKIALLLLLLQVGSEKSFSQSAWFSPESTWYDRLYYFTVSAYIKQTVSIDTVIDGTPCKKLELFTASVSYPDFTYSELITYQYVYEANGVVYGHTGNPVFDTLYNFKALPGDRWNMNALLGNGCMDGYIEVADTGHILINGVSLKFLQVNYHNTGFDFWVDTLIERIGSIHWGFFMSTICITDPEEQFCSYSDSEVQQYPSGNWNCDFLPTGIPEVFPGNRLRVFPNPVLDWLEVETSTLRINDMVISDLAGRKILEIKQPVFPVDVSSLLPGIYICEMKCNNKTFNTKFARQ